MIAGTCTAGYATRSSTTRTRHYRGTNMKLLSSTHEISIRVAVPELRLEALS